ncbi:hypothetical protein BUALT_Bualt10G0018600 [Buddleja alternifolia]|uniref:Hyaluronan/mRNA-binding protein domain-containing protein n=1 Tax=Buddleja alternifolia TaxID=168488 RepID=A0AAV6X687_9LAMI|nr:hypothetical protein BUALT_Bualt10G0018600 [Buddleja alternifolia]
MATVNPFDLLDDDAEDPTQLLAAEEQKVAAPAQAKKAPAQAQPAAKSSAKLPSKPLPPAQAVKESRNDGQRGGRGAGRGGFRGRGGRGFNRDLPDNENTYGNSNGFSSGYRPSEDGDSEKAPSERRPYGGPREGGGFRGGRRGGFSNGETVEGERPRRVFDRRSGTGRGPEFKREGAGRGNWGTPTDEIVPETEEPVNEVEKNVDSEKQPGQEDVVDATKESDRKEQEEKEPEPEEKVLLFISILFASSWYLLLLFTCSMPTFYFFDASRDQTILLEMTLEEYEKVLEEKRKALLALKSEERKVNVDKELESMQLLSNKKNADEIFVKLGSDKDKRKEAAEKAKKSVSINEFLKPAEGDNNYRGGGRGRGGRGRGRGGGGGGYGGNNYSNVAAPAIEDVGQFPSLAAK